MIDIPLTTPMGRKINSIGIWVSGGADSALLCYLLVKKIKDENLPITLIPMTVDYKRPFQNIGSRVVEKIKNLLQADNIISDHINITPSDGENWYGETLTKVFHDTNYENFKNDKIQLLFSGITTNPDQETQKKFKWGVLPEVEIKRGHTIKKETVRYFIKEENNVKYEFIEYKPFFNVDKRTIAQLYKEHDIQDTLFPLTRSCEKLGTVIGHCGDCWWCEERFWAFNKL